MKIGIKKLKKDEEWNECRSEWTVDNALKKVQNPKTFQLPAWCVSPRGSSFRSLLSLGVPQPTKGKHRQSKHATTALDSDEMHGSQFSLGEIKAFRNAKSM